MPRALIIASLLCAIAAAPAQAQDRPQTADSGLRYLTWPGKTPQPERERPSLRRLGGAAPGATSVAAAPAPAPRTVRPSAPPPVAQAAAPPPPPPPPPVSATSAAAPQPAAPSGTVAASADGAQRPGVRYYSLHRESGRQPDPLPEALRTGREEISVVLSSPDSPSLAERDRIAAGQERLELARDLPPSRAGRLLDDPL